MKKSVCAVVVLFIFTFLFMSSSAFAQQQGEYKKIYRLGVAPLIKEGVRTVEKLVNVILKETEAISLLLSGRNDFLKEFYRQFPSVKTSEFAFDKSDHVRIEKMSWRSWDNKPRVTGRVEYAGEEKVESYIFKIDYLLINESWWFLIPKKCGNISLWKIEDFPVPVEKIEEKPVVVIPEKEIHEYPSRISVQAETIQEPKPKPVTEVKQTNDMNYFADLAGGRFESCYQYYTSLRGGLAKGVGKKFELSFVFGVHFPLDFQTGYPGTEEWKVVFTGDTILTYRPSSFFIGGGVGMSSAMKANGQKQFEGIGTVGISSNKIDLFGEVRIPIQKGENIKDNNKILVGLRMHWGK